MGYTGLRMGETRRRRVGDVVLDAERRYIDLRAEFAKTKQSAQLPLHGELAARLRAYLDDRRQWQREEAMAAGTPGDPDLAHDAALFPHAPSRVDVFDADCKYAGLAKRDSADRVLDVHSLRHTYCTMIAQSGCGFQTATRLMRHATPSMTMRYTHLELSGLGAGVDGLPMAADPAQDQNIPMAAHREEIDPEKRPPIRPPESRFEVQFPSISRSEVVEQDGGDSHVPPAEPVA